MAAQNSATAALLLLTGSFTDQSPQCCDHAAKQQLQLAPLALRRTKTNPLINYPWLRFCSLLIHSRMYGEQLTSRTPSVSHLFRNRSTSTSTSVTSSSCSTAPGPLCFELPCHFRKILRLNSTDQPDGRAALADNLFDLQGHVGASRLNATSGPFRNYCKDGQLQTGMMLIFRQMPNCQQSPAKSEQPNLVPRWSLSASSEMQ